MESDDLTLEEFLDKYGIEGADTSFKRWYQMAFEQECSGGWSAYQQHEKPLKESKFQKVAEHATKEKFKLNEFKTGDLVKRKSTISEGATGIVTRVDEVATNKYHGKKYLVTFQQNNKQIWLNADQLELVE